MRIGVFVATAVGLALAACAGRDPELIPTVQAWDAQASCAQIRAEIEANNGKVKALADEQGLKVAQNVVAGVGGFLTLGIAWFAMDAKGAATKDVAALQSRQQYLAVLAQEKCATPPPAATTPPLRRGAPKPKLKPKPQEPAPD